MSVSNKLPPAGSISLPATPAAAAPPPAMVQVWDAPVRAFHWSLVGLFLVAYLSGEDAEGLHLFAGYCIVGLLALRVYWGFRGPLHARFSDFVKSPREVLDYMKLVRVHRAPRYLGHNPAGGAMAIALLLMIGCICFTGHLMTTTAWWGSETMEDLHDFFSSHENHENLTMSMVNGLKRRQ